MVAEPEACAAHAGMAAELDRWHDRLPASAADLWHWCRAQDQTTLLDLLATYTALAAEDVSPWGPSQPGQQLAEALALDMTRHWRPTAAFTARLSRPMLMKALTEAGREIVAADITVMKKATAATKAAEALEGAGWLPLVLRRVDGAPANDNVPAAPMEGDTDREDEEAA